MLKTSRSYLFQVPVLSLSGKGGQEVTDSNRYIAMYEYLDMMSMLIGY